MKKRNFFAFLLALVLCFSLTTTTFAAEKTNTVKTAESVGAVQPRAGGGSAVRFISGEGSFTFQVGGTGMQYIKVEVSGTTSENYTVVNVTSPTGISRDFYISGNNTQRIPVNNLTAGTYSVYAITSVAASVVAVYVE